MDHQSLLDLFSKQTLQDQLVEDIVPCAKYAAPLSLPSGDWYLCLEQFDDGSYKIYFNDFPDIVAGGNSCKEAVEMLSEIVYDELNDNENISDYQKRRLRFLQKVFSLVDRENRLKKPLKR